METFHSEWRAALNAALSQKDIDWDRKAGNHPLPPHSVGVDPGENDFAPYAVIRVHGNHIASYTFSELGSVMKKKEDRDAIFRFLSSADNREAVADWMSAEVKKTVWRNCRLSLLGDGSPREIENACRVAEMLSPGWGREIVGVIKSVWLNVEVK